MKLSNKILIGFLGFIFLYMTAVFAEIRFRGTNTLEDASKGLAESVDIERMTYLVLPDLGKNINVVGSDKSRMEVKSTSGDLLRKLEYKFSGDTLTLVKLDIEEDVAINITIYVPKNSFSGMTLNGTKVTIKDLEQEELYILQNEGRIEMAGNNMIDNLQLDAKQSFFYLTGDGNVIKTMSVDIENSEVVVETLIKQLKGSMKNKSYLGLTDAEEIQIKKDTTSHFNLYN